MGRALAVMGIAVGLLGCVEDTRTSSPEDPVTEYYVLSSIRLEASDGTPASGVDLDGLDSTGVGPTCADRVVDLESVRDPGERGVDNAMAALVPTFEMLLGDECAPGTEDCLGELIAGRIASGELLVGVEVRDVISYAQDPSVEVVLHRATSSGVPELRFGELAPDQSFALEPLAVSTSASIVNGLLRASFDTPFTLDLVSSMGPLPVRTARLEAMITDGALHDGVLAGGLDVDELVATAMCDPAACEPGVLEGVADLSPRPEDPTRCAEISFGLDVAAVSAAEP